MYSPAEYSKKIMYSLSKLAPALALIFCASAVLLLFSAAPVNRSQIARFAIVCYSDTPISEDGVRGIKDGLKKHGYEENRNYKARVYSAHSDSAALNGIIDAVISEEFDLIFTISTPALQAALKKIKKTPIIFSSTGDPVGAGAGESFTRHAANVTGICSLSDFSGMINLVGEIAPAAQKIGTIFCPSEINSVLYKQRLEKAALEKGIKLEAVAASTAGEVADAAESLCAGRGVEIICQIADNLSAASFTAIIKASAAARIPVFGFVGSDAKHGAALSYAKDYYQGGIDSANLAARILKGESPAGMPFEYISKTTLIINKKAALSGGLKIPESVCRRADSIIE